MDDSLRTLLDAEMEAQSLVDDALRERERILEQAHEEARTADERFSARVAEIHASFVNKANERADRAVAELQRRFDEQRKALEQRTKERAEGAVEAVLAVVLDTDRI